MKKAYKNRQKADILNLDFNKIHKATLKSKTNKFQII